MSGNPPRPITMRPVTPGDLRRKRGDYKQDSFRAKNYLLTTESSYLISEIGGTK